MRQTLYITRALGNRGEIDLANVCVRGIRLRVFHGVKRAKLVMLRVVLLRG